MKFFHNNSPFFLVAATCSLLAATAYPQQIQINKDNRTIAITATDSASVMADTAAVNIGFVVYAPDAETAYSEGSKRSNAIIDALIAKGVAKATIQSESQNVSEMPQHELEKLTPAEQARKRFYVRQSWIVQTKADDAANVLNIAVQAGANQSGQIEWFVEDENALQAKAAGNALSRARAIASQMAQGLGIKLGVLVYASNQNPEPQPMMMQNRLMATDEVAEAPAPLAIEARVVERSATVYAVFAIQ